MKSWGDSIQTDFSRGHEPRQRRRHRLRFLAVASSLIILLGLPSHLPAIKHGASRCFGSKSDVANHQPPFDFDWNKISASHTLEFHPCYDDFQCAKLKLPLDYFNGTHPNETVSIAIAKLPAKVSVDDPRYAGPMLINPGGPGGSGVMLALGMAHNLQTVIDPAATSDDFLQSQGQYYDILGFDPRGVGWTEPVAVCSEDEPAEWSWRLREETEGMLGSSDAALGRLWSMNHAYGASCQKTMDAEKGWDIKQYMSTASVARDMLEIAEKHAIWVFEKANELTAKKGVQAKWPQGIHDRIKQQAKLQYWGFSYGTYLGSTFASMFPDRVKRVVLDGVVNVHDYNNSLGQGSLNDTEKDMSVFYTFCASSGPENCPLATPTSSAQDIEKRVQKIIQSLYHSPLVLNSPNGPEILTYTDIRLLIFGSLYNPAPTFPLIAGLLAEIETGGGELLDMIAGSLRPVHIYSCSVNGSDELLPLYRSVAEYAILCGEGVDQTSLDLDGFEEYWHLLERLSPAVGSIWASLKMKCASWNIRAKYSFANDGNFGGNTSHPILWISNTADPVTPLKSGRLMAERFPGSAVLVQDSAGHCSLSTPTACTVKAVKDYFQTGALPSPETVCIPPTTPLSLNSTDPDSPFYDPSLGQATFVTADGMEKDMSAAMALQSWSVGANFIGRGQWGERIKRLVDVAAQSNLQGRIGGSDEL